MICFPMLFKHVQNRCVSPLFELRFLFFYPDAGRCLVRFDALGCGGQIVANMKEIQEIASVLAKPFFNLGGDPARAITDRVQLAVTAKTRPAGAVKEDFPRSCGTARQGAAVVQGLASVRVRQGDPGFFPAQDFAFATIRAVCPGLHNGDHAAVCLGNDPVRSRTLRPGVLQGGVLIHLLSVRQADSANHAFIQEYAVVLDPLVHGARKGNIGSKVGHRTLQGARYAAVRNMGGGNKGAYPPGALT